MRLWGPHTARPALPDIHAHRGPGRWGRKCPICRTGTRTVLPSLARRPHFLSALPSPSLPSSSRPASSLSALTGFAQGVSLDEGAMNRKKGKLSQAATDG